MKAQVQKTDLSSSLTLLLNTRLTLVWHELNENILVNHLFFWILVFKRKEYVSRQRKQRPKNIIIQFMMILIEQYFYLTVSLKKCKKVRLLSHNKYLSLFITMFTFNMSMDNLKLKVSLNLKKYFNNVNDNYKE